MADEDTPRGVDPGQPPSGVRDLIVGARPMATALGGISPATVLAALARGDIASWRIPARRGPHGAYATTARELRRWALSPRGRACLDRSALRRGMCPHPPGDCTCRPRRPRGA